MLGTKKKGSQRIMFFVVIMSALAVGGIVLSQFIDFPFSKPDPLETVPYNSALVIEVKSPEDIFAQLENKPYSNDIQALGLVDEVVSRWQNIQDILHQFETNSSKNLVIAAQIGAENELDYVFILNNVSKKLELADLLRQHQISHKTQSFNKQTFYNIELDDTNHFSIAHEDQYLIIAESPVLVESVLDQIKHQSTNILKQKNLKSIRKLTGKNAEISLYLNMEYIPVMASFFTKKTALQNIQFLKHYAKWVGLDITFQEKTIGINGYLAPAKDNQLLESLNSQKLPEETLIANVLPDNTAAMTYLGYKEADDFFNGLKLASNDDFKKYFVPWLGNEVAYVITEPNFDDYNAHQFAVFRIRKEKQAEELLEEYGQQFGQFKSEKYFNYTIHHIMASDIMKPIFGNGLNPIHNPYYVILDDYLVLGNSEVGLKELLDKYTYGQTLGQDINYLQFVENLSATSNKYFYINTANILNILTALFQEKNHNAIRKEFQYYQKLTPIGVQFTPYKNLYFINAQIQYNPKGKQATSVIWKADLDAEAAIAPIYVKNHLTEEWEIFIQDTDNKIYLLDKNGERIWKEPKQLEGRIISDVHQIDFYKNTYLQYLFNTNEKIYLIDRTGERVQGFPITLNSKIINGLMVVDYDNTRDYRYFVACEDGNIFGFKQPDELLEGWSPKANIGKVRFPLQHFNFEEKDYIVALNEDGEMFFFQRNGEVRMDSVHFNTTFLSPFGYDLTEPQRIVATNGRGKAYVLNFEGKHFKLGMNIGEYEKMKFEYADVLGNDRKDYVILGNKEFGIFSYTDKNEFKGLAQRTFDTVQDTLFQVRMLGNPKMYIGTFSKSANRVYLLDGKAQMYPDFPIPGTTPFQMGDLYNDGKNVLVVANGNSVFAYKIKQIQKEKNELE